MKRIEIIIGLLIFVFKLFFDLENYEVGVLMLSFLLSFKVKLFDCFIVVFVVIKIKL